MTLLGVEVESSVLRKTVRTYLHLRSYAIFVWTTRSQPFPGSDTETLRVCDSPTGTSIIYSLTAPQVPPMPPLVVPGVKLKFHEECGTPGDADTSNIDIEVVGVGDMSFLATNTKELACKHAK